jgi:uncharacterized protein YbjQ (UPF0145 family)
MSDVPFFVVTVNYIPDYLSDYQVKKMYVQWAWGNNPDTAVSALQGWAKEKGYNGIIDLRIERLTTTGGGAVVSSDVRWFAYGTLVKFA